MWLIMNDEVDYPVMFYPTHIVSKDKKVLPLYIGASQAILGGLIGLYIKDKHYPLIRHDKAYIIIHDPEVVDDDIDIKWDDVPDSTTGLSSSREHIHIWKEVIPDYEKEATAEGGTA